MKKFSVLEIEILKFNKKFWKKKTIVNRMLLS